MKRFSVWIVSLAVVAFAVVGVGVALTDSEPRSTAEVSREVAQSLRCPTCAGESIADSAGLLSEAMRSTVEQQVREGRTPEEIQAWFAERYGDEVLLEPPLSGLGWVLWTAPLLVIGAVVVLALRRSRSGRATTTVVLAGLVVVGTAALWLGLSRGGEQPMAHSEDDVLDVSGTADVLGHAAQQSPGDAQLRLAYAAALEEDGELEAAVAEYAAASRLQPLDPDIRYRHAFALVRNEDVAQASELLEESMEIDPDHAPTLLLLGTLVRDEDSQRGEELLSRFVELQPEHPAAEDLTELLEVGP